jgi:hypothetical protein
VPLGMVVSAGSGGSVSRGRRRCRNRLNVLRPQANYNPCN